MNNNDQTIHFTKRTPYKVEGFLKLGFCLLSFITVFATKVSFIGSIIGLSACVMGIYRQIGRVQFNKQYLANFMKNDFGLTLFYIFLLFSIRGIKVVFCFPVVLFFMIGVSEMILRSEVSIFSGQWFQSKAQVMVSYKDDIKRGRCLVELVLFFYSIFLLFWGRMGFLFVVMLFNYLRIKGMANPIANSTFNETRYNLVDKLNRFSLPGKTILIKIVEFFFKLLINAQ